MNIALAQLNPTIGDIASNVTQILDACVKANAKNAALMICPELSICGYPPRDLLQFPEFIRHCEHGLDRIISQSKSWPDLHVLVGTVRNSTYGLTNSAVLVLNGMIVSEWTKHRLPYLDVFDDYRHFTSVSQFPVFSIGDTKLGVVICEDLWVGPKFSGTHAAIDPMAELCRNGATLIVSINASPFELSKSDIRHQLLKTMATRHQIPIVYVNQVGANDDIIFDGSSMAVNASGQLIAQLPAFKKAVYTLNFATSPHLSIPSPNIMETLYHALVLGIQDYVSKSGFSSVVLGLSGGIDSAVVAALACDALGPSRVTGVMMSSPFSSEGSISDSVALAKTLNCHLHQVNIETLYDQFQRDITHTIPLSGLSLENLQARIRGTILMTLSNQTGALVLSTGNKSEIATGYCTLYGDMCGGLAPIADCWKTQVYALAHWINRNGDRIPSPILQKPPSAELRPNQTDQDSLPPYEILDALLDALIVKRISRSDCIQMGYETTMVNRISSLINMSEYKRRQSAIGLKVSAVAFGSGRRIPVAKSMGDL